MAQPLMEQLIDRIGQVVLGKEQQVRIALACLLARGHLLLEDLPGMGKTTLSQQLAQALGVAPGDDSGEQATGTVEATGRKATVAGIAGEVYRLTSTDASGRTETREAVFTGAPLVVEMTEALYRGLGHAFGSDFDARLLGVLPEDARGILSVEDSYELHSISSEAPAANRFELPAEPVDMGGMLRQMMQQRGG